VSDTQNKLDASVRRLETSRTEPPAAETNGSAVFSPAKTTASDEEVIAKCRGAENAAKFADLFDHGDTDAHHAGDESSADLALISMLAFYTQDEAQLERLFSASALGQRDKWRKRGDYRKRTIAKALGDMRETYDWASKGATGARPLRPKTSSSSSPLRVNDDDDNDGRDLARNCQAYSWSNADRNLKA
jgi:hypothetical protein